MAGDFDFSCPLPGRYGLFGGTFDPIHNGHLYLARTAMTALRLDGVIFMVSGDPPHKQGRTHTPAAQRLSMVRLALENERDMYASTFEIGLEGPSYTYKTVECLKELLPDTTELIFLVGGDSLKDMPGWRYPERILAALQVAAVYRPGSSAEDLEKARDKLGADRITLIPCEGMDVSSTAIRAGEDGMNVPDKVAEYIRKEGLYIHGQG